MARSIPQMQKYPRLSDSDFLDDSKLVAHSYKFPLDSLKQMISSAIPAAQKKSGRAILNLPDDVTDGIIQETYKQESGELFRYFIKYYGDPAGTLISAKVGIILK